MAHSHRNFHNRSHQTWYTVIIRVFKFLLHAIDETVMNILEYLRIPNFSCKCYIEIFIDMFIYLNFLLRYRHASAYGTFTDIS